MPHFCTRLDVKPPRDPPSSTFCHVPQRVSQPRSAFSHSVEWHLKCETGQRSISLSTYAVPTAFTRCPKNFAQLLFIDSPAPTFVICSQAKV